MKEVWGIYTSRTLRFPLALLFQVFTILPTQIVGNTGLISPRTEQAPTASSIRDAQIADVCQVTGLRYYDLGPLSQSPGLGRIWVSMLPTQRRRWLLVLHGFLESPRPTPPAPDKPTKYERRYTRNKNPSYHWMMRNKAKPPAQREATDQETCGEVQP